MPNILITNDDGVKAQALVYLKNALAAIGEVTVLAPESNWSAAGHTKTMHKPLRLDLTTLLDGSPAFTTNGAPSDCVALAVLGATGTKPDLVVSGINEGYNLGSDVTYSGTVAAAMEAVIYHTPAIAISACSHRHASNLEEIWQVAAQVAADLARRVLDHGLPPHTLLNVNIPCLSVDRIGGPVLCRLGARIYEKGLVAREDPRGRPYFWYDGSIPDGIPDPGTDVAAIKAGLISITPLNLDLTDYSFLRQLESWKFAQPTVPSVSPDLPTQTVDPHDL